MSQRVHYTNAGCLSGLVGVQTNYCLANSFKTINLTFPYLSELTDKITIKEYRELMEKHWTEFEE